MDIIFSAFSRPQRSSEHDCLFRNVSKCNMLARVTGGLKSFYDCIKYGKAHSPSGNIHTDADGRFVPRQHMVLANRYRIQSCIETGGQSAVLVEAKDCFHKMLPVVIKVMHTSYLAVGLKEVHTLRTINSADPREISHTVRLLNAFRLEDHICLVFPLLNPLPLTDVFADKFLQEDQVLQAIRKISLHLLSALAFLRSLNIIHADVKPENILLCKDEGINTVTLIDFGNAIHHIHSEVSLYYTDFELQTQPYRAPEVHLGNPFGVEVDMWSLGCVLLELFTGHLTFAANDRASSLKMMISALGPLPKDMCKRGKFYYEVESLVKMSHSSHSQESGALRLMFAFPCIKNYEFASFLSGLLTYHPDKRMTPWEALQHPFMAPLICIPHFLTGADVGASTGVIRKTDYHYKQNIPTNVQRLYPSTFDLLRAGTSDQLLLGQSNVTFVEPLGMDEISLQREDEKAFCIMQKHDGTHISSSEKNRTYKQVKYIPTVESREFIKPVKCKPFDQNNFIAAAPYFPPNITLNLDVCRLNDKLKKNLKDRSSEFFGSEPVFQNGQSKCELTDKFKTNSKNSLGEFLRNEPVFQNGQSKCELTDKFKRYPKDTSSEFFRSELVFQNGQTKSASPLHESISDYDTNERYSSHGDALDVGLMNHLHFSNGPFTSRDNFVTNAESKVLKLKNVASDMSQMSAVDDSFDSGTIEAGFDRTCPLSDAYRVDHYNFVSSTESAEKMSHLEKRDMRSNTSAFHQIGAPIKKYLSPQRKKQNESMASVNQVYRPNELSQGLPNLDYPRSVTKCIPPTAEKYSFSDQRHSFVAISAADECHSPFTVERRSYKQSYSFQENKYMCKEPRFQEAANEKMSLKNAISHSSGIVPIDIIQNVMAENSHSKQKHKQDHTLNMRHADVCSTRGGTDLDSFHHQITLLAEDKQDNCLKKTVENVCYQTHGNVKPVFPRTRIIYPQNLERDQTEVTLSSEDESMKVDKEVSLLNTTQEYPLKRNLVLHTTKTSCNTYNNSNVMFDLPTVEELMVVGNCSHIPTADDKYVDNCSHIPSTDNNRYVDNCSHASSADERVHVDKLVGNGKGHIQIGNDLANTFSILPVSKETRKELPAAFNHKSSSTVKLIPVSDHVKNDVTRKEVRSDLPVIFRNEMEVREITKMQPVIDLCDILDEQCLHKCKHLSKTVQLSAFKMGGNKHEMKETIPEKTKVHKMEKTHCLRSNPDLKINVLKRKTQDCFVEHTNSLSEFTDTSATHKDKHRPRMLLSCTKQRASVLYTNKLSYRRPFKVFRPKHYFKSSSIERENNNSKHSDLCHTIKRNVKCRKESSLGTSSFKSSNNIRSAKMSEFQNTTENNNQNSESGITLEQVLPPEFQKKSLKIDVSADQATEEILDDNLNSSHLDVSSLRSRVTEIDNMSTSGIGPILNENFRLCLAGKDLNHDIAGPEYTATQSDSQGMRQNNLRAKSLNASRLLRAKSVKRALLFNTEKSPKFYVNKKSTKSGVQRSLRNSEFPAKKLKTETSLAYSGGVDDNDVTLSQLKSSGNFRKTNHQFLHLLSSSVNDHNSSDPYEFKVTPAKLQHATDDHVEAKKKGIAHQTKMKPSVPISRINCVQNNLTFSSEIGSTVTISDLVEKKSRHMLQNVNSSKIQDKVTPLNMVACKNPTISKENMKSSVQVTKKAKLTENCYHNLKWDSAVPVTDDKKSMSGPIYTRIKTSASTKQQSNRISEILMSTRRFPSDESNLACALNLPPSSSSPLEKVQLISNMSVTNEHRKASHCVISINPSKPSNLEQTAPRKRKFVPNIDVEELTVSQETKCCHLVRLEDSESTKHYGSTFDFAQSPTLKSVAAFSVQEENNNEEEILLLE